MPRPVAFRLRNIAYRSIETWCAASRSIPTPRWLPLLSCRWLSLLIQLVVLALLVTALVAVIGYAFLDCTSIPRKTQFKTLFYIFVSVLVVLYLHYFVVQNTLKHDVGLEAGRALMRIGPTGDPQLALA